MQLNGTTTIGFLRALRAQYNFGCDAVPPKEFETEVSETVATDKYKIGAKFPSNDWFRRAAHANIMNVNIDYDRCFSCSTCGDIKTARVLIMDGTCVSCPKPKTRFARCAPDTKMDAPIRHGLRWKHRVFDCRAKFREMLRQWCGRKPQRQRTPAFSIDVSAKDSCLLMS